MNIRFGCLSMTFHRRSFLSIALTVACAMGASGAMAAEELPPLPYYSALQAVQGIYGADLPPLARQAHADSRDLLQSTQAYCQGHLTASALHQQWRKALVSWQALGTPAVGPLVERRTQRQIDFWPAREKLIERALKKAPATLADMDSVGTPAKGFPGFELLLGRAGQSATLPAAECQYLVLVAEGIDAELGAVDEAVKALAGHDWEDDPEAVGRAFAEWVNQWLGALERLRWAYIGKPLEQYTTAHAVDPKAQLSFARADGATNLVDWKAQWARLSSTARMTGAQHRQPPLGGDALLPIEALLRGKGHIALADRWVLALGAIDADLQSLPAVVSARDAARLQQLSAHLQTVSTLFHREVAGALDVPLGFSDADGD